MRLQRIIGSGGVDARQDAQQMVVIYLKGVSPVACPCYGSHQYGSLLFLHRLVEADFEERLAEQVGTRPQLGIDHLFAKSQFLRLFAHLFGPVARKFRKVVF